MSTIAEALQAVKQALLLAEEVKRMSADLIDHTRELRDHDRRITRLEAQWDTALALARPQLPKLDR